MKVAVCLDGQPKDGNEKCLTDIKKYLIDPYNSDVFIVTGFDNSVKKGKYKYVSELINNLHKLKIKYKELLISEDFYFPQKPPIMEKVFEQDNKKASSQKEEKVFSQRFFAQLYALWKCNKLKQNWEKQNNFKYDWVVRSRLDININKDIIDLNTTDISYLYIPKKGGKGYNDRFCFGSSELVDIYCNRYEILSDYDKQDDPLINPEHQLEFILKDKDINVKIIKMPIKRDGLAS